MRRRDLIAALGVALWPGLGRAGAQRLTLSEAFVMLDSYLALPPAERDRFSFAYRIMQGKKPAPNARAAFVDKAGARTPVTLSPDGTMLTLPTLAQLKSKAMFEIDGDNYQFVLEPLAAIAPAARIDVNDLAASLAQLNAERAEVDLVVIVSDNQSWVDATRSGATQTMIEWDRIVRRNPAAKLVCIDIQPQGTTQASGRAEILNVGGFSDAVFDTIARFAQGEARDWVEIVEETEV